MMKLYYSVLDAVSGGHVYHATWMAKLRIPPVPMWAVAWFFNPQSRGRRS